MNPKDDALLHAIVAAVQAGDVAQARALQEKLAQTVTSPQERDAIQATVLVHAMLRATEQGDHATAAALTEEIKRTCTPTAVQRVLVQRYLRIGQKTGSLPAPEHDGLMGMLDDLGYDVTIRAEAATIRRTPGGQPPGA